MQRKDFLKSVGIAGLNSIMIPLVQSCKKNNVSSSSNNSGSCVIIPQETQGPYPLDLSSNPNYFRQDITEGKTGVPLNLTLTVVNVNSNCSPLANTRVDIWQCDKDGVYSGFGNQTGGVNTTGQTFLRGIQLTDSMGQAKFSTIYPGWYPNRIAHIHFQVYLNNGLIATSQIAFPENITTAVYATSLYSAHGQNTSVANNAADMVFGNSSSDLQKELCTITSNATTGGYDASLNVGIAV